MSRKRGMCRLQYLWSGIPCSSATTWIRMRELCPTCSKEVSDYSGLTFTYVYCDSYAEALYTVERGEADILGFFIGTDENALEKGLARTAPYVEMDSILVRNKESSYPAPGLTGGVLEGREMPSSIVAETVRYYAEDVAALSDVNRGKTDFYYGISSHLEHTIQTQNFTNLVQVSLVNDTLGICFAMPSPRSAGAVFDPQ